MPNLTILIGVPGSGKSTWAKKQENVKIVCPDDIRADFGDVMDQTKNKEVWAEAYWRVIVFLRNGHDVILDATHATRKTRLKSIDVGLSAHAKIIGLYFPVSAQEAKIRNLKRARVVPDHVIDRMIQSLAKELPQPEEGYNSLTVQLGNIIGAG